MPLSKIIQNAEEKLDKEFIWWYSKDSGEEDEVIANPKDLKQFLTQTITQAVKTAFEETKVENHDCGTKAYEDGFWDDGYNQALIEVEEKQTKFLEE